MFKGSITALITPFKNGEIDEKSFQDFVEWQINQGTHGFVPSGTTGESPTLNHQEHERIIDLCIEVVNNKVPVIAGTGSNSTEEAISLTKYAQKAGANGALIVTPYYNKPTQDGLFAHYKAINDNCDIPIIIYNIPGRSVVDIDINTMEKLSKLKNEHVNDFGFAQSDAIYRVESGHSLLRSVRSVSALSSQTELFRR